MELAQLETAGDDDDPLLQLIPTLDAAAEPPTPIATLDPITLGRETDQRTELVPSSLLEIANGDDYSLLQLIPTLDAAAAATPTPIATLDPRMELGSPSLLQIATEDDSLLQLTSTPAADASTAALANYNFSPSPLQILPPHRNALDRARLSPIMGLKDIVAIEKSTCSSPAVGRNKENINVNNVNKSEVPKLSVEPQKMKRRKRGGACNLRKSLAWDKAFFTEEGVLNPLELSILSNSSSEVLPTIKEEGRKLNNNPGSTIDSVTSSKESENAGSLLMNHVSSGQKNAAPTSVGTPKKHSNQKGSRTGSKSGGCPRPLVSSSLKRPANASTTKAAVKESKLPKTRVSTSGVLNPLELPILSGSSGNSSREVLPTIHEEVKKNSSNSGSTIDSVASSKESENAGSLLMNHVSSGQKNAAPISVGTPKMLSNLKGSRTGAKSGGCTRPLDFSSLKRPANASPTKAAVKESKLPKIPVSTSGVLNPLELPILRGNFGNSSTEVLPTKHEEVRKFSSNSGSTIDSATTSKESENASGLSMNHVSLGQETSAPTSVGTPKMLSNQKGSRTGAKSVGCTRPLDLSSRKRPANASPAKATVKESKLPKIPVSTSGVLNPQELPILSGSFGNSSKEVLPAIHEVGRRLNCNSGSTIDSVTSSKDSEKACSLLMNHVSSSQENAAPTSVGMPKMLSNQKGSKTGSKSGGCPRPSLKRHANESTAKAAVKESMPPKIPVSSGAHSLPKSSKNNVLSTVHSQPNQIGQSADNFQKSVGLLDSSNNAKSSTNKAKSGSDPLPVTAKSSRQHFRRNMTNLGLEVCSSTNPQPTLATEANSGLAVFPATILPPTVSRAPDSHDVSRKTQNTHRTAGNMQTTQFQTAKPSGLRMPSPSLGFFGQPKSSAANSSSPKATQPSNTPGSCIPSLQRLSTSNYTCDRRPLHAQGKMPKMENNAAVSSGNARVSGSSSECSVPCASSDVSHENKKLKLEGYEKLMEEAMTQCYSKRSEPMKKNPEVHNCTDGDKAFQECGKPHKVHEFSSKEDSYFQMKDNNSILKSRSSDPLKKDSNNKVNITCPEFRDSEIIDLESTNFEPQHCANGVPGTNESIKHQHVKAKQCSSSVGTHEAILESKSEYAAGEMKHVGMDRDNSSDIHNVDEWSRKKAELINAYGESDQILHGENHNRMSCDGILLKKRKSYESQNDQNEKVFNVDLNIWESNRTENLSSNNPPHESSVQANESASGVDKLSDILRVEDVQVHFLDANLLGKSCDSKLHTSDVRDQNLVVDDDNRRSVEPPKPRSPCLPVEQVSELIILDDEPLLSESTSAEESQGVCDLEVPLNVISENSDDRRSNALIPPKPVSPCLPAEQASELIILDDESLLPESTSAEESQGVYGVEVPLNIISENSDDCRSKQNCSNVLITQDPGAIEDCGADEHELVVQLQVKEICSSSEIVPWVESCNSDGNLLVGSNNSRLSNSAMDSQSLLVVDDVNRRSGGLLELQTSGLVDDDVSPDDHGLHLNDYLLHGKSTRSDEPQEQVPANALVVREQNDAGSSEPESSSVAICVPQPIQKLADETDVMNLGFDQMNVILLDDMEIEISQTNVSPSGELQHKLDNAICLLEDEDTTVPTNISKDGGKQNNLTIIPPINAVPFSDEWLAAMEAAGEDVLTLKSGAVQNSPPDRSLPEPSPWSPVKRKHNEIGPFDCTKFINIPPPNSD